MDKMGDLPFAGNPMIEFLSELRQTLPEESLAASQGAPEAPVPEEESENHEGEQAG